MFGLRRIRKREQTILKSWIPPT